MRVVALADYLFFGRGPEIQGIAGPSRKHEDANASRR